MLYELRKYEVMPGKLPALLDRFGGFTVDRWKGYGIRLVAFWTPSFGGHNNRLVYILAWKSVEERNQKFAEFRADPEREKAFAESEKNGPLVEQVTNMMMAPTAFSPLK